MPLNIVEGLSKKELESALIEYMIPVETSFLHDLTIQEVLKSLQGRKISHAVSYFYAVDNENRLCGIVSTRDILFSKPEVKLADILHNIPIKISRSETLEEALKLMAKHEFMALPVVDEEGKLCGIFELSQKTFILPKSKDGKESKSARDIFQLIGLSVEQSKLTSSFQEFRYRMPWLLCNLVAGLICAAIASSFHNLLSNFVMIAAFIPLVLTLGESVAMQSMSLSLQFLSYGKIPKKRVFKRIFAEWKTALLLGIACALLVAIFYMSWYVDYLPMIAISSSIFISMILVTSFASLLPMVLNYFALDPKVAAGPVVLMITDIIVTSVYLGFSSFLLISFWK